MNNKNFKVDIDTEKGGISSLIFVNDSVQANIIKSDVDFNGILCDGIFTQEVFSLVKSTMESYGVRTERESEQLSYVSEYSFTKSGNFRVVNRIKNRTAYPLFFQRGEVGINLSICDEYPDAETCLKSCFHRHFWCGGSGASYLLALRMGESTQNVGLIVTQGGFSDYSQRNVCWNNRGECIAHPEINYLEPYGEYILSYEIFPCQSKDDFFDVCKTYEHFIEVHAKYYTVFVGECLYFEIECRGIPKVFLADDSINTLKQDGKYIVNYLPKCSGEYIFTIQNEFSQTKVVFCVVPSLQETVKNRVKFIIDHQQEHNEAMLSGAYLVFDNQTQKRYYNYKWTDCNAGRERIGMGILIARYLQKCRDEEAMQSLLRFEKFVRRELYDEETGYVFDDAGRAKRLRLYNFLWVATFYTELFYVTKDKRYISDVQKIIRCYYKHGGAKHYPNSVIFSDYILLMQKFGTDDDVKELTGLFQTQLNSLEEVGEAYPKHEVNYEQTIVSPAVTLMIDAMKIFNYEKYGRMVIPHLKRLERFDGIQPHYKLNCIAIRYWDGYWFGKRHSYGDTFPHYWSALSSMDYCLYGEITNQNNYVEMGENGLRNCLCLFFEDGSASAANVFPYKVNGNEGDYFDPYSNDQDFALYYALRFL